MSSIPTGTILIDQLDKPSEANDYDNIKFKDVIITDEATNLVSNRSSASTRLKSITGVAVTLLSTDKLRIIATKLGVKGSRKSKKIDLCTAIVSWVSDHLNEGRVVNSNVNRKRYINVIFGDTLRPALASKGALLDKDDLTEHRKLEKNNY